MKMKTGNEKEMEIKYITNILQWGKCYENVINVMEMLGMLQICYT